MLNANRIELPAIELLVVLTNTRRTAAESLSGYKLVLILIKSFILAIPSAVDNNTGGKT